ncbi:FdtA/QdtA family cupin domain-containing protein [Spirulina sp. CS-785/01]|uniref:sugar 3,4-ketoisomerase n=1 Tax=Spirulina sp. CS-785/01 TaxID=3021716 RepID=UPI00232D8411|nr:FdtA/QdtA family cupin domain-containing protein [Spirulina sp. CS-785/01]MDB9313549.1 FdtA/QdtA family cupin domain-containing protein [Spirulina sp. CS-785/01]
MNRDELLFNFPQIGSPEEGYLAVTEEDKTCPFAIARTYWVYGCPDNMKRGGHAHYSVQQLLICVAGEVEVTLYDGKEKEKFVLNQPTVGLLQKPLVWGDLIYRNNAVLLVLASDIYSAKDYIRDYDVFLQLTQSKSD